MTVNVETPYEVYDCNGSVVNFPIPFTYSVDADIVVELYDDVAGTSTPLANPAEYSIVGSDVVTVATYPTGNKITVYRDTVIDQQADYVDNDAFPAEVHEDALDKLTRITAETDRNASQAIKLNLVDLGAGFSTTLPVAIPSKGLKINAAGTAIVLTDNDIDDIANAASASAAAAAESAVDSSNYASNSNTFAISSEDSNLESGSWANEDEDVPVKEYTAGVPSDRVPAVYSAKHWSAKAEASVASINPSTLLHTAGNGAGNPEGYTTAEVDLKEQNGINFKNKLINGCFRVWQRGTSQTTANGYGSDDRFFNIYNGVSTHSVSQQSFTPGQTDVPGEPEFFSRTVITTGGGANDGAYKAQLVEDVRTFAGKSVVFSFWAKADAAKQVAVRIRQHFGSGGSANVDQAAVVLNLTTSWQRFEVPVTLPSIVGKTIGTGSYVGLFVYMDAGSNFGDLAVIGNQSGTFDYFGWQLEEGSIATDFEQRPLSVEEMLCKRYFERIKYLAINEFVCVGQVFAAGAATGTFYFSEKRVVPALSLAGNFNWLAAGGGYAGGTASHTLYSIGQRGVRIDTGGMSGLVSGNASALVATTTPAYFDADAEL